MKELIKEVLGGIVFLTFMAEIYVLMWMFS